MANRLMDLWRQMGVVGAPQAPMGMDGIPPDMVAAARNQAQLGVGAQLMAAGFARTPAERSAAISGIADAGDMSRPLYNMAQARLMATPKPKDSRTDIQQIGDRLYLIDLDTGDTIRELGPAPAKQGGEGGASVYGNVFFDESGNAYTMGKNGQWVPATGLPEGVRVQSPEERAAAVAAGRVQGGAGQSVIDYYMKTGRGNLEKNVETLQLINQGRGLLNQGIQAGSGATIINSIRGWARTMGVDVADDILVNTQAYQNFMRNTVIPRMKDIGGNDSNEEMQKMEQLSGADINQAPEALRLILDYTDTLIRRKMKADRAVESKAIGYLGIDAVPEPEAYQPPGAGGSSGQGGSPEDPFGLRATGAQ